MPRDPLDELVVCWCGHRHPSWRLLSLPARGVLLCEHCWATYVASIHIGEQMKLFDSEGARR